MKACKDESIVACNLLVGSNLLLILESCILDDIDCSSLLFNIPINALMHWESSESDILKNGLAKMNWWERSFQQSYPVTYERLQLVSSDNNWRWMVSRCEDRPCRVWKETLSAISIVHAVQSNDEFGSGLVHQLLIKEKEVLRTFSWGLHSGDSETQCYFRFNLVNDMFVRQLWTIQAEACLVLIENRNTGLQELLFVKPMEKGQDLRFWALNRNVFVEDPVDFVLPVGLDGNPRGNGFSSDVLLGDDVLVASTVDGSCCVVVLARRVGLLFDPSRKMEQTKNATWRDLLTNQFVEPIRNYHLSAPSASVITACCFVLDEFLLVASNDGVIRAHPRSNIKSEYYVENVNSLVSQMTSLFNVVALIHSYSTLEVRRVFKTSEDPFLKFELLYRFRGVDCDHAPLLFGPFVVFAGLDGVWYRVLYDGFNSRGQEREEIKIPGYAGWKIVSVKNANWNYLVVVVRRVVAKREKQEEYDQEELFLFH
jgi:hypothetical protein